MANSINYFVISYDADYDLPYGFAWFSDIGAYPRNKPAFTYFATREEAFAMSYFKKGAVLLDEEKAA